MNASFLANGRRLAYRLNGRSRQTPLVLLHGFCEDGSVWDALMPHLGGLRVLRPDLPGFGRSDLALTPGIGAYADAVCALLNELAIERCVLVGHSMGGYTALEFAARYGERLAGLGLVHSHPYEDAPDKRENRRRGIEQLAAGKKNLYVAQLFPTLFAPAYAAAHPEVVEALMRRARRHPAEGIAAALEAMISRADHTETLRGLNCPALFVLGEADGVVPLDLALPATHLAAVSDLQILPGVGHMGMLEAPGRTAAAIRDFWNFCVEK